MSHHSHQPDLPQQIAQDLRALGGVQAPSELWQRVQEERGIHGLGVVSAPEELWARVQTELRPETAAPQGRLLKAMFGRKSLAAAAALLVFAGLSIFNPWSSAPGIDQRVVVLAPQTSEAERKAFRDRAKFQKVAPQEMSSISRGLAGSLGGFLEDDA